MSCSLLKHACICNKWRAGQPFSQLKQKKKKELLIERENKELKLLKKYSPFIQRKDKTFFMVLQGTELVTFVKVLVPFCDIWRHFVVPPTSNFLALGVAEKRE